MRIRRVIQFTALVIAMLVAVVVALVASGSHRLLIIRLISLTMPIPDLGDPVQEGENAYWFDDYYTVFRIDDDTWGIGEPRYHQMNFNYLLLGTSRAILFDSGPGVRDISPVVRSLTSLPVTSAISHLHYDHTGNYNRFDGGAMIDLPALRARTHQGRLRPNDGEHLGFVEGFDSEELVVTEWWQPGQEVDLGGRRLIVHHTPGHTRESIVLQDPERDQFFTGDTLYPGELFAFLPGSSLGDYTRTIETLLSQAFETSLLYGAHRAIDLGLPMLGRNDLLDVATVLHNVRDGNASAPSEEGVFPRSIEINKRISMLMDIPTGRQWH